MKESLNKLSPFFFGERETFVSIKNDGDGKLEILAESAVNGSGKEYIDVVSDDKFVTVMDLKFFKDVPDDYRLYSSVSNSSCLIFKGGDDTTIILISAE